MQKTLRAGDQPDVVLLNIDSNDINNQTKDKRNAKKLTGDIINTGKCCINLDVKEVVISSILPKKNIAITRLRRPGERYFKVTLRIERI